MKQESLLCNEILKALRKIIRAIDLNSKKIFQKYGLTGPQLLILKELSEQDSCPVGYLAKLVSLSHATVTEIIDRLENKGYVKRQKSKQDKRKILISLNPSAEEILVQNPTLIQEQFIVEFSKLPDWEQSLILSNFQKVAHLMHAENIDTSPILINTSKISAEGTS